MIIYLASGNAHKVAELQSLADASGLALQIKSARDVGGMPAVAEDAGTFVGNARKKALALRAQLLAAEQQGRGSPAPITMTRETPPVGPATAGAASSAAGGRAWVLADDSGVCVDALDGAPGVDSAYYAGPEGDGAANLAKLIATMRDVPASRRTAHFLCVLLLIGPDGAEHVFEGRCSGRLLTEPRGGAGFGYDPLFVPDGYDRSYAELGEDVKNSISHRARAWARLAEWVRSAPAR